MIQQTTFTLRARARGFHLVTDEVLSHLPALPKTGLLNLFIQHTSAGLSVNENCDPDVRSDMEKIFNNLVRERDLGRLGRHACPCQILTGGRQPVYPHHRWTTELRHLAGNLPL